MPKPNPAKLSHFTASGRAAMVDVGAKPPTRRTAAASAFVALSAKVIAALPTNPKGLSLIHISPQDLVSASVAVYVQAQAQ